MQKAFDMNDWKRNIALFLGGQAVTLIGSSLVGFAIVWHVTLETQSSVVMTVFTIAAMLPMFLISPFAGAWADRFNRKYLINIADASIAIVTLIIALCFTFGINNLELLFVCTIIRSFGQGIQMPAVNALVAQITPEEHLIRVNGISGGIQSLSQLGAPALAGALLTYAELYAILYIDVVTAIIGISILFFLVKIPIKSAKEKAMQSKNSYFDDIKSGLRYISNHQFLKRLFIISALFNILLTPAMLLSPLQVVRDFGPDVWRLTAVEMTFSIGMLCGGITIALWAGFKNKTMTMIMGTIIFGIVTIGLGVMNNFILYLCCMIMAGLAIPIVSTPSTTILQTKVANEYLGRGMSALVMISSVTIPFGMLIFGPLGDRVAIDYLMIGTGIGTIILGLYLIFDKVLIEAGNIGEEKEETELTASSSI